MMRSTRNKPNPAYNGIAMVFIFILVAAAILLLTGRSDKPTGSPVAHQQDQQAAIQRLADESGEKVKAYIDNGVLRNMQLNWRGHNNLSEVELVWSFLDEYADIFNVNNPRSQFKWVETRQGQGGFRTVVFSQIFNGVPVYASNLNFQINPQDELISYSGGYIPNLEINTTPKISYAQALKSLTNHLGSDNPFDEIDKGELIIITDSSGASNMARPVLAWSIWVISTNTYSNFFIDANTGNFLGEIPILISAKDFEIYDAKNDILRKIFESLFGFKLVMDENGPIDPDATIDQDAKNLFNHHHAVYDFFKDNFNWESYDGKNSTVTSVADVDIWPYTCPNAFWDPKKNRMLFCNNATQSIDIFAHEFTHGVTTATLNFSYPSSGESETRALSESLSDIFAAFIDDQHRWQICFTDCEGDDISRDLADPGNNPEGFYPAHYDEKVKINEGLCKAGEAKYGCGHINSTIHSRAVYLFTNQIGEEKSQHIIFYALSNKKIPSDANFLSARIGIVESCLQNIGNDQVNGKLISEKITEADCRQVELAYNQVGIVESGKVVEKSPQLEIPTTNPQPIIETPEVPISSQNTDTILLVDASNSMDENDSGGTQKMAAAQKAAGNLLEVIASEQQAAGGTLSHQVGLVSFSDSAKTIKSPTSETVGVKDSVDRLFTSGGTAMAAGLQEAYGLLDASSSSYRMIVLLSDGVPSIGLDGSIAYLNDNNFNELVQSYKQEVLGVAGEAKSKNICIHTVGFGDPSAELNSNGYIDENFLRQVAAASGCGRYYGAQESIQLANAFIELRHSSMGALLLQRSGQISQGETLALGTASVPANQSQLMLTVNWPGSQVIPQLIDPSGKPVNDNYPGAVISQGDTVATILVDRPAAGDWQLSVFGQDVPQGVTSYNALISTRAGLNTPQAETSPWLWAGLAAAIVIIGLIAGSSRSAVPASAPYGSGVPRGTQPPAGRSSAHLVGTAGGLAGKRVRIGRGGLVGRGPSCQLVIPDPAVSREHARLYFAQNHWFIQDLGSRSGTFINNQRVQNAPLQEGVSIRLGNSTFTFHER